MPLAIDFGNSRIKLGYFIKEEKLPSTVHFAEYDLNAFELLVQKYDENEPCAYSTVASSKDFEEVLKHRFSSVHRLSYQSKLPFDNQYQTPQTLGNDRIAACAGAMELTDQRPLLVIDAGSCITYDFITEADAYIGGAISPGIEMKLKAMHHFTEKLPKPSFSTEDQRITVGKTTQECLLAGAVSGTVHEILGFAATFSKSKSLNVVLTGGNSEYLADQMENSTFAAPNLVLAGLNKIRKLNAHK